MLDFEVKQAGLAVSAKRNASHAWKMLEYLYYKNNFKKAVQEKLEGKSIALVGKSPSLLGESMGEYIDSHDVVVRINGALHPEKSVDLGSKTDIHFVGANASSESMQLCFVNFTKACVITNHKNRKYFKDNANDWEVILYPRLLTKKTFDLFQEEFGLADQKFFDCGSPRSGFVCLNMILLYGKPRSISVFGFSLTDKDAFSYVSSCGEKAEYPLPRIMRKHCQPHLETEALRIIRASNRGVYFFP